MPHQKETNTFKNVKKILGNFYLSFPIIFSLSFLLFPWATFGAEPSKKFPHISVLSKLFKDKEIKKYKLQIRQPYRFSPKFLMKTMSTLAYQKRGASWSSKRRVFKTPLIRVLAPRIAKQFTRVNPDERVFFRLKSPAGRILLEGDTFMAEDGMHWRLTVIQKIRRMVDDFSLSGDSWRLAPRSHQAYKTKRRFKRLIEDITNWIVLKQIRPDPERILSPSPARRKNDEFSKPSAHFDIKERLRILDDLKKEGLIDEREYKNKRREILKDL